MVARSAGQRHSTTALDGTIGGHDDTPLTCTNIRNVSLDASPFASLLREHLNARPNLRTGAGPDSPWLFPSAQAGRHLHPDTVMDGSAASVSASSAPATAPSMSSSSSAHPRSSPNPRPQPPGGIPPCRVGSRAVGPLRGKVDQILTVAPVMETRPNRRWPGLRDLGPIDGRSSGWNGGRTYRWGRLNA